MFVSPLFIQGGMKFSAGTFSFCLSFRNVTDMGLAGSQRFELYRWIDAICSCVSVLSL